MGKKRSFSTDVWRRLGIIQVNLASALALHKRSFISRRVYYKSLNFSVLSRIATKRTCQGRLKGNLLPICRPFPPQRRDTAEMPVKTQLKSVYTEPGLKGDTATNTLKPAKLETGVEVRVPLFINEGEIIEVDMRDGSYVNRLKA